MADAGELVEATGREKDSQAQTTAHYADYAGATSPFPATGVTTPLIRRYTQTYTYDPAGNILEMAHTWGSGGWTRGYAYEAGNNQLLSTSRPGDTPSNPATHSDAYAYNDRGAMVFLPHLNSAGGAPDGHAVLLVKPQFEVGREHVGTGGRVRDTEAREAAIAERRARCEAAGFVVLSGTDSPVAGARSGNVEHFLHLAKSGAAGG